MKNRGFVALMSVIVISAILLVYVFTLGTASFFNRFDSLNSEHKHISAALAAACAHAGMLNLAQGNYANTTVSIGEKNCTICSVSSSGRIVTRAVSNGAYTNLEVEVEPGTFTISSWREVPAGPPGCSISER